MRVLLLDEQPGSRKKLAAMLPPSAEVIEANDVDGVLAWTRDIDLAIVRATFDTDEDPEDGVTLAKLRKLLDEFDAPFVVLTSETANSLASIRLRQANYLFTFGVPLDVSRLERTLGALTATLRRCGGTIAEESLDALLVEVVNREESGVLTVARGAETRRVVVDRGHVVFCTVERTGADDDVYEAFDCGDEPSSRAAWDAVLEFYLWGEGEWRWFGAGAGSDVAPALPIRLAPLRAEGKRRQQEWTYLRADVPADDVRLVVRRDRFPPQFPVGDLDRQLVERIGEGGATVGSIRAAWGRQDFPVCRRIADLVRLGVIEAVSAEPKPRRTMEAMALAPCRMVRLAASIDGLFRENLSPSEAFIVSRLSNGEQLVEDVLSMCPMPWEEVLRSLGGMIDRGLIAVRDLRGEKKSATAS